jgi:hypothetical protein
MIEAGAGDDGGQPGGLLGSAERRAGDGLEQFEACQQIVGFLATGIQLRILRLLRIM